MLTTHHPFAIICFARLQTEAIAENGTVQTAILHAFHCVGAIGSDINVATHVTWIQDFATKASSSMIVDEEVLRLGTLVANDVVNFEAHTAFFRWSSPSETFASWHYGSGLSIASMPKDSLGYLKAAAIVGGKRRFTPVTGFDPAYSQQMVLNISPSPNPTGFLIISRSGPDYSPHEQWLMSMVGLLMRSAQVHPKYLAMLRNLHLQMIDQRVFPRNASHEQILDRYLGKVLEVLHPEVLSKPKSKRASDRSSDEYLQFRVDAKLANANKTELKISRWLSFPNDDAYEQAGATGQRYVISERDTIAARVYSNKAPFLSNSYRKEKRCRRVFHDSRSHLSAPILFGEAHHHGTLEIPQCLGVFTCETTSDDAYTAESTAAISLLAAHAAWPLGQALIHSEAEGITRERDCVANAIGLLSQCSLERSVFSVVESSLVDLGYARGLFCSVNGVSGHIDGFRAWGGVEMESLCSDTHREFVRDSNDCQILAIRKRESVVIDRPQVDPRVNRRAAELAELQRFAIVPFVTPHNEVTHTIHVERQDLSPLSQSSDIRLIEELVRYGSEALDRIRLGRAQSQWTSECLREGFISEWALLESLAITACDNGIASRCRIYRIDGSDQVGISQAGVRPVRDFDRFALEHPEDRRVLKRLRAEMRPLLVVTESGDAAPLQYGDFPVEYVATCPHDRQLHKRGTPEWVEAPIILSDGSIIAKLVYDNKGKRNQRFTPQELQWITATTASASLACDALGVRLTSTLLAKEGLAADTLRHAIRNVVTLAIHRVDDGMKASEGNYPLQAIYRSAMARLDKLREMSRIDRESQSIKAEVDIVADLVRPLQRHDDIKIELGKCGGAKPAAANAASGIAAPLPWMLLKLLANAIEATTPTESGGRFQLSTSARRVRPFVAVKARFAGPSTVILSVIDNGSGIPERFLSAFDSKTPRLSLGKSRGEGKGLLYIRLLADECDWKVRHIRSRGRTQIEISFPVLS